MIFMALQRKEKEELPGIRLVDTCRRVVEWLRETESTSTTKTTTRRTTALRIFEF
jgi:hypothetical protein